MTLPLALSGTAVAASGAATAASGVTIGIIARSGLPRVSGHTLVAYRGPAGVGSATVSGSVSGAAKGDRATLWFKSFRSGKFARSRSVTLSGSRNAPYSFSVRPETVTSYQVRVSGRGVSGSPASQVRNVYVEGLGSVSGKRGCSRPVCRITLRLWVTIPASAYRTEAAKHWYLYLGLRLSSWRTPPAPRSLSLSHTATASKPQRRHLWQFAVTLRYRFRIGKSDGYTWRVNFCTRDTVTADGLGLPGHHGCGDKRISATTGYLG